MSALDSDAAPTDTARRQVAFYYGWVQVVVAALAMTATLPGSDYGVGLIEEPLVRDLGLSATSFASLNFWAVILGAVLCWPAGRLTDRWGTRTAVTVVAAALGAAVMAMSAVRGPLGLFVTLTLVRGLGKGALSVVSLAIVGKWFRRRLGPAMGLFSILLTVGFIASTFAVGPAAEAVGWRQTWFGVGLAVGVGLTAVGWLLVRSTPRGTSWDLAEEWGGPEHAPARRDFHTGEALRTPAFWVFTLAIAAFGLMWAAVTVFNESTLADHGFDRKTFYTVMAVLTAAGMASNLVTGWLAMRWPLGRLLAIGMTFLAGSLVVFPGVRTVGRALTYAAVLGASGGAIVVVFSAFYADAFGRTSLARIQGVAQVVFVLASALGPWLLANCRVVTGSYDAMFLAVAPVTAVLGLAAWGVPYPAGATGSSPGPRRGAESR